MSTIKDIAAKYKRTESEVRVALQKFNGGRRPSIAAKVRPEEERFLASEFLKGKKAPPKEAARPGSGGTRRLGDTQIVERKRRSFTRPGSKPSAAPAAKSAAAEAASAAPASPPASSATKSAKPAAKPSTVAGAASGAAQAQQTLLEKQAKSQQARRAAAEVVKGSPPPPAPPPSRPAKGESARKPAIASDEKITIDPDIAKAHARRRQHRTRAPKRPPVNVHGFKQPTEHKSRDLPIPDSITVVRLAGLLAVKSGAVLRKLMEYGMDANANMPLDYQTASVVVEEFGHKAVKAAEEKDPEKDLLREAASADAPRLPRPPVVTIMGHVDHGKTSLLDYIRKTQVAAGEAGGITQHIGAYQVPDAAGDITFLDTPGHSLFSQMRARGAQITDIVILVVAGDDGVRPQTEEAISHAQAANVPLVVAVNKMDKPGFDMERVKTGLAAQNVLPEDWSGDTQVVPVSAHTGEGVDKLLSAVRAQSEILELAAARDMPAQGVVVEARIDKGRGALTTVIVREGVLRRGDYVVCGAESGRVRAMWDGAGRMLEEAPPSTPAEIQGLSGLPEVGEPLTAVADERKAREVAGLRQERRRMRELGARASSRPISRILDTEAEPEKTEFNIIVKADVGGSREALAAALAATSGKKAAIKVIHSAVGGVSESDVNLARASNALIIAFNVRPSGKSRKLALSCGIKILYGNVIYEIIDNAKNALLDLMDPEREERIIGMAEVLKIFSITKVGNIAGCRVSEGVIRDDVRARLVRDGAIVYEGEIDSLRHFKEKSSEIKMGEECGIAIRRFHDFKVADVIEAVQIIETPPTF